MARASAQAGAGASVARLLSRPYPPATILPAGGLPAVTAFLPAPELSTWIREAFVDEAGPLHDSEFLHLADAQIGCLWTSIENERQMRRIVGQAEMPGQGSRGGRWQNARAAQQLMEWFGEEPDFLITIDAAYAAESPDVAFCALIDHELRHCGQALDAFGAPRFNKDTGLPVFAIRGHDVEEFVGTVRRFGAGADVQRLIDAAAQAPEIAPAGLAQACGTCQRRAA